MNKKNEIQIKETDNLNIMSKVDNINFLRNNLKNDIRLENEDNIKLKEEDLSYIEETEIIKFPLKEKFDLIILVIIGFIVLMHIIHFLLSEYVRYLFNYNKL